MLSKVEELLEEVKAYKVDKKEALEAFRLRFISKKGVIKDLFSAFKDVPNDQKKRFGQKLNELKVLAESKLKDETLRLSKSARSAIPAHLDLTLPPPNQKVGSIHPLSAVRRRFVEIFERMGFNVSEGPEIEDDWHNFSALNFPANHPAREMQDTYFISKDPEYLLRTHTSTVQIRAMEGQKPPIRTLAPGRVYRNEAITARAHCFFHQMEGLYIDKEVSFKDMKHTLYHFCKEMFGDDVKIRLRPSYFPFTEPSAELDTSCRICKGEGCNVCKYSGWVEILGCGMVDPNVLKSSGIDPEVYSGFAFGCGIERTAMLKYDINDLRLFSENDARFLSQFQGLV